MLFVLMQLHLADDLHLKHGPARHNTKHTAISVAHLNISGLLSKVILKLN